MSRIGRTPVELPAGVTVTVADGVATIKGPKGQLTVDVMPTIDVKVDGTELTVTRKNEEIQTKAFHGLVRSLIFNAVEGVTNGYKKTLKLVGTGYRVTAKGKSLSLAVGFSHPVEINPTEGVTLSVDGNDTIYVEGIDKGAVGQMAADIRAVKPPEPYKGKGIRYEDEVVRRKAGKTAA